MKTLLIASIVVSSIGALVGIGFFIAAGVQYRMAEDAGLDPGYTAPWAITGLQIGAGICILGVLGLLAVAFETGRRRAAAQ